MMVPCYYPRHDRRTNRHRHRDRQLCRRSKITSLLIMVMMVFSCIICSMLIGVVSALESTQASSGEENKDDSPSISTNDYDDDDDDDDDGGFYGDEDIDDDDDDDDDDAIPPKTTPPKTTTDAEQQEPLQDYVDDETGEIKSFNPNQQFSVTIENQSKFRADVYWDDDKYGVNIGAIAEPGGGTINVSTNQGHNFFVTRHGVRENLHAAEVKDGEKDGIDSQIRFVAQKPNQRLIIPKDAAPLSGERLKKNKCIDRYGMCKKEAARGACSTSPGWMIVHCCESCNEELNASELLDAEVRCTREQLNMTGPAWQPGDLDKLFAEWVTDDQFKQYSPVVISSPDAKHGGVAGPWIITFDTFLTDYESDQIWEGGQLAGFDRSTDQGKINEFGEMEQIVSKTRTSSNAWCTDKCERQPGVQSATTKIESVTGIPRMNYESFQVLEYQPNQFYRMHHDSSSGKDESMAGHRILTFFLYLSDVEEGGETRFTKLGLDVKPRKGKALIWPSVLNDNPQKWDSRMFHEARDVIRGEKRAANHWIHLYDYETPNLWGCTGSFS